MHILSTQKLRFTLGFATLLLVSAASIRLYPQSINQQQIPEHQAEKPLLVTQSQNYFLTKSQISPAAIQPIHRLGTIVQNPVILPQISPQTISPENTFTSEQDIASIPVTYPVIDEWQKYKFSIEGSQVLSPGKLPTSNINFNQKDLFSVLVNTRKYFQDHASEDPNIFRKGLLGTQGVTVEDIIKTLDFMITVLSEDIANNRTTRLENPEFINTNFRVIKWSAHNPQNQKQNQVRITKYAVFEHTGSRTKTSTYNVPIYSLKEDNITDKFYTRYTKQDVLSGIYEPGGKEHGRVEPLAYLTRAGLEEALMQGTILINFTDGTQRFFNVDRNNGISYVQGLKPTSQKRYWYFRQVDAIKGYGHNIDAKISIKPGVTFAGDILNIGLGRVVVIEHTRNGRKQLQMGVMADTGGAFLPNLHQLDFLAGTFKNRQEFTQHIRQLPEYATAYFLVKK
ncbi:MULTISPECIES: hypothetical protein [unclassified Nodularia (in: cyanobacteria)]|uniref:hypothetical protein n=1 Tax=unclassified Nodularia (in: cyanobacteria) TaxID=2656917 RepID=UPI0018807448|nr:MULTISPECIES: hypothetical protein [unclassified Nodularia (in: cyanobacteria)]MBE9199872.1 hypothetical protein [Nodularia sp. LEGE 06071]MCC2692265.1 hypothetical protein [Nodularia sp. LEGE 04288]